MAGPFNTIVFNGNVGSGALPAVWTAQRLIYQAMRDLAVIKAGQDVSAESYDDGLNALNWMVDSWNAEANNIYSITRAVYDLVQGTQTYSCGPGGDFDGTRPIIERAGIIANVGTDQPPELPLRILNDAEYAAIVVKNVGQAYPQMLYSDGAYPLTNLFFWPIPSADLQVALYQWELLQGFASLTADYSLPPGYIEALRWNLASNLAPSMVPTNTKGRRVLLERIERNAVESKARMQRRNISPVYTSADPAMMGSRKDAFNYLTGLPT